MDQLRLPSDLKQLVAAFRGVRPLPGVLRGMRSLDFVQDRELDMQWESEDEGRTWSYRWVGGPWEFRTGRPVHPLTSPEWSERRAFAADVLGGAKRGAR